MDEVSETPPQDINPYEVLGLTQSASESEVRSAYKKLALKNHPGKYIINLTRLTEPTRLKPKKNNTDKVPPHLKDSAHLTFQQIAFAYAILSSPHRRRRYDSTGSTSESIDTDDDFDWADFFRAQFFESLTADKLTSFAETYKSSAEEQRDVLTAYTKHRGKLNGMYADVMLSNPLEDEERFRAYIAAAIEAGEVEAYDKFVNEPKRSKDARMRKARNEAKEAEKEAAGNERYQSIFGKKGGDGRASKDAAHGRADKEMGLAELIQAKNKGRAATFLDGLEQKYAGKKGTKRKKEDEPPEEAFQRNGHPGKEKKITRSVDGMEEKHTDTGKKKRKIGTRQREELNETTPIASDKNLDEEKSKEEEVNEMESRLGKDKQKKSSRGRPQKARRAK
ncbi:MAG: hypothetical protein Q9167_001146 [Letrouitia subvulpina]